jgi:hypothetical protein
MKDRDFLFWLRDRLVLQYKESANVDFVQKLHAIGLNTPNDRDTRPGDYPNFIKPERTTMRSFMLNDQEWNADMVGVIRDNMIQLRDMALKQAHWDWAVQLSLCVGVLAHMIEWMKEEDNGQA